MIRNFNFSNFKLLGQMILFIYNGKFDEIYVYFKSMICTMITIMYF